MSKAGRMKNKSIWVVLLFALFNNSLAEDSTDVELEGFKPMTVLTLSQGYVDTVPPAGTATHTLDLPNNMVCPTDFKPFVSLVPYKQGIQNNYLMSMFSVCVQKITPLTSPPRYQVTYLIGAYATRINQHWAHVRDYDNDESSLYGSIDDDLYTGGKSRKAAYWQIEVDAQNSYGLGVGINWTLYCYPPGMTAPTVPQANCTTAVAPYLPTTEIPKE